MPRITADARSSAQRGLEPRPACRQRGALRTGEPAGLGVELLGVDRTFREEFLDFVRGGIIIDDEVVIEDGAPANPPQQGQRNEEQD